MLNVYAPIRVPTILRNGTTVPQNTYSTERPDDRLVAVSFIP